jgi:hypothetical protein
MKRKPCSRRKRSNARSILRLPDLEHAKAAVLNSLTSADAQRGSQSHCSRSISDVSHFNSFSFISVHLCQSISAGSVLSNVRSGFILRHIVQVAWLTAGIERLKPIVDKLTNTREWCLFTAGDCTVSKRAVRNSYPSQD